MTPRIRTLVKSWLVIDFFSDSRRLGEPGSSLTSTIFTQSFLGLIFAAVFLPEEQGLAVAYLAMNLSLSAMLIGIGVLGDPVRTRREQADELLVRTAPMPAGSLTLARALHGSFYLVLVSTGMAIPAAVLAYWACGHRLAAVPLYLLMAVAVAGLVAGVLAVATRFALLVLGPIRTQLVAGTVKALMLAGLLLGFVACLPHMGQDADALPFGRTGVMLWPPYWAARVIDRPLDAGLFWLLLAGSGAALFALATLANRLRPTRTQNRPTRSVLLDTVDRWIAGTGPLLGVTRFVGTMFYRSPAFRGRVLPLLGVPAAMVLLSLIHVEGDAARKLLLGVALQAPTIGLPFFVGFMRRSDHENAGWIFHTCPHRDLRIYRTASAVALTTHVLVPAQFTATLVLLLTSSDAREITFALAMPLASLGLGIPVARLAVRSLATMPFSDDSEAGEDGLEFGGLTFLAILLSAVGAALSIVAQSLVGVLLAAALLLVALRNLRSASREAIRRDA